jgi:hypothetical protein
VRGKRIALLPLPTLIELKLASGLSAYEELWTAAQTAETE